MHRDLSGNFTVVMPAHAVGNHHEKRVARVAVRYAILAVGAFANSAFLINCEFHLAVGFLESLAGDVVEPILFLGYRLGDFFGECFL